MIRVRWQGLAAQQKLIRDAERKFKRQMAAQVRKAGNIVNREARANLKDEHSTDRSTGRLARAFVTTVFFTRKVVGSTASAAVGVSPKKRFFPAALYAPSLEHGGKIQHRGRSTGAYTQRGRRRLRVRGQPYVSDYGRGTRFLARALVTTRDRVVDLIGQTFRQVGLR